MSILKWTNQSGCFTTTGVKISDGLLNFTLSPVIAIGLISKLPGINESGNSTPTKKAFYWDRYRRTPMRERFQQSASRLLTVTPPWLAVEWIKRPLPM